MDQEGKLLQGRYRLEKQIGQGGMGAVFIAVDERFGSTVAIKQTLCMDDNYRRAIEREARLLNSLKHVALPRVSDHFVEEDGQYIVMEYIPGEDLCCILDDQGRPFTPEQVVRWADQLLDALDFLHNQSNPVIHRDIKPQNLKIMPNGQIILLDFGLAKGNPTDAKNHTAAKSIFGYTRNYASLEQIQGTGTDPRSDLYSLAATLYHLVTGIPPEDALTRAMAVLSNQPDPLRPAHLLNPDVPPGLSAILHRTLDLNAANRPETAMAMREMLRDHERYAADLPQAAAVGAPVVTLHEQKTKLFNEATRPAGRVATGLAGQRTDRDPSQLTEMRPDAASSDVSAASGSRRIAMTAGGLTLLLVLGAGVGGFLYYENSLADTAVPRAAPLEAESVPAPTTSLAAEVTDGNPSAVTNAPAATAAPAPAQATADRRRSPAVPRSTETVVDATPGEERIVIDGETIYMGNMKVRADRIETPEGVIDLREARPSPPGVKPPPDPFQHLTPEQRAKIREAIRRSSNALPKPTPPQN